MNKIKYISLSLVACMLVAFAFGSFGVQSTWYYSEAISSNINIDVNLVVMPWEGADDLPNQSTTGNNHKTHIQNVLYGTYESGGSTVNIGLNTPNSYLNQEIADRKDIGWRDADMLGSMDIWQSDRINEYFSLNDDSNKVEFILEFPDSTPNTYYLYTTSVELGDGWNPDIPEGNLIYPIYKTTLEKNSEGIWEAVSTEVGSAKSAKYANPLTGLKLGNAFDTSSFTPGRLGTSTSNAVYTASGLTLPVESHAATDETYYYFTASSNADMTVTINQSDKATLSVYDSSNKLVSTKNNTVQNSNKVTFRASRNAKYYVKITGDVYCTFTVS